MQISTATRLKRFYNVMNSAQFDVVVATINVSSFRSVIDKVLCSTVHPNNLIFSITNACIVEKEILSSVNPLPFRVIFHKCIDSGQVAQRISGMKVATSKYVLFMDDDIDFSETTLGNLLGAIASMNHSVIGAYIKNSDGTSLSSRNSRARQIFNYVVHGYQMDQSISGTVSEAGFPFYVSDEDFYSSTLVETQWLPGGIQILERSSFPVESYYDFAGKAYCEDLYLSEFYTRAGIKMFVLNSLVYTEVLRLPSDFKSLKSDFRARFKYVSLTRRSKARMIIWYVIFYFLGVFNAS